MKRKDGKGTFTPLRLTVAARYPRLAARSRVLWLGALLIAAFALYGAIDLISGRAHFLSNGPLSSPHANLEEDCAACHSPGVDLRVEQGLAGERCAVCHEKFGDEIGVYSWAAHYLYRSDDFQRLVPSEHEEVCAACHREHRGREADLLLIGDRACLDCHDFGSFSSQHPQFDLAAAGEEDPALIFPHIHHVREVMKQKGLLDLERACLYCHNAEPSGAGFEPISFDRHCDACHLTSTTATARLPIAGAEVVGVESLEMMQAKARPGSLWTLYANPDEVRSTRRNVRKAPVHHRDPWVLDNLRLLRQRLYPDAGLADLLVASPDAPPRRSRELYREAVETLRAQALELRSRPEREVQSQLAEIESLLVSIERALEEPTTPLDESRFLLDLLTPDPALSVETVSEIESVVAGLTEPCRVCHRVERATIVRVQADQGSLHRAEFNHRAHILQRRCLDCHREIPFVDFLASEDEVDPAIDRAEIVNLPRIEVCRECHREQLVSNRCTTCHLFHPNKSRRSDLLLYLDEEERTELPRSPAKEGASSEPAPATGDSSSAEDAE